MIKKRLIGVVTVLQGRAVQSIGYHHYLPLGKPEILIENLDRWGVDEILIQCIDRSTKQIGPDFPLLTQIGSIGLSTPLIYGGGIRNSEDAVKAVSLGADRVVVDSMIWDNPKRIELISRALGIQALIMNMPVSVKDNRLYWRNYRSNEEVLLTDEIFNLLGMEWVSEVMLTDWLHEGVSGGFDSRIPALFPQIGKPLLIFGGLSEPAQYQALLSQTNIVAVGVGNFLNYKEHAVQKIKNQIVGIPIRTAQYAQGGKESWI